MGKPEYVYVASSWSNPIQTAVVAALRAASIDCYDFKTDGNFRWSEVFGGNEDHTIKGPGIDIDTYLEGMTHPRAIEGFQSDLAAMQRADTCVLVLPCNRSAHLELGWFVGQGIPTAVLLEEPCVPELMYKMVDHLSPSLFDLLGWLGVED